MKMPTDKTENQKMFKKLKFDLRRKKIMRKLMEMFFSSREEFGVNIKGFTG